MPSSNCHQERAFSCLQKSRNGELANVLEAISGKVPEEPIAKSALVVERYRNYAGKLDWRNAYGGLKPLLDFPVAASARNPDGLGLIQDDSPTFMPEAPRMTQFDVKRSAGCTVMRLYAVN